MKNTALTSIHEALGAKMVPFAGYNMPVSYEGVTIEHETVRKLVKINWTRTLLWTLRLVLLIIYFTERLIKI